MDSERWERIQGIFNQALPLSPEKCAAFLDEACSCDNELRQEVESLLAHHRDASTDFMPVNSPEMVDPVATPSIWPRTPRITTEVLAWRPGDVLFRKYCIQNVKHGGMARVFVCRNLDDHESIVIKIPNVELNLSRVADEMANPFRAIGKELAAWISVDVHPNVVRLISATNPFALVLRSSKVETAQYCRSQGMAFEEMRPGYVGAMMFVPGLFIEYGGPHNLREYLDREPTLAHRRRLELIRQVSAGMTHCASRGVSPHLDLKPQNVLVDTNAVARVTDFGLSKTSWAPRPAHHSVSEARSLHQGQVCGTPAYMAPEQWTGSQNCDEKTDIFAFGLLAFETLTGQHPFLDDLGSIPQIRQALLEHQPDFDALSSVDVETAEVIRRCLKKDPRDRYQTWQHLMNDLGHPSLRNSPQTHESKARGWFLFHSAFDPRVASAVDKLSPSSQWLTDCLRRAFQKDYRGMLSSCWSPLRRGNRLAWIIALRLVVATPVVLANGIGLMIRLCWGLTPSSARPGLLLSPVFAAAAIYLAGYAAIAGVLASVLLFFVAIACYYYHFREKGRRLRRCACGHRFRRVHSYLHLSEQCCALIGGVPLYRCWICPKCTIIIGVMAVRKREVAPRRLRCLDETDFMGISCKLMRWKWQPPWPHHLCFGCCVDHAPGASP